MLLIDGHNVEHYQWQIPAWCILAGAGLRSKPTKHFQPPFDFFPPHFFPPLHLFLPAGRLFASYIQNIHQGTSTQDIQILSPS